VPAPWWTMAPRFGSAFIRSASTPGGPRTSDDGPGAGRDAANCPVHRRRQAAMADVRNARARDHHLGHLVDIATRDSFGRAARTAHRGAREQTEECLRRVTGWRTGVASVCSPSSLAGATGAVVAASLVSRCREYGPLIGQAH
jgi:hypothetical protein